MGFEHVPTAFEPCCHTHCAMRTSAISNICQGNHKNISPNRDSNPDLLFEKFLSSPHYRDHLFNNKNSWQKYTVKKKKA